MSSRISAIASLSDSFGRGTSDMAEPQIGVVLFLLGLITGVVAMVMLAAAFIYLKTRRPSLPPETEDLLDELHRPEPRNFPRQPRSPSPEPRDVPMPWERDADWWRENEDGPR